MQLYLVPQQSPHMEAFGGKCMNKASAERRDLCILQVGHEPACRDSGQIRASFSERRASWSRNARFTRPLLRDTSHFHCRLWPDRPGRIPHLFPSKCQDAQIERKGGRCVY